MQKKYQQLLLAVNSITLLLMLFANYVFSTGILSPNTVADISHKYDTLITPAGYAFIIWSVIFLLCIAFVVFQFVLYKRNDPDNYILKTGWWFAISNLANTAWLYAWTNEKILLAVLLILLLLSSLIVLTVRLRLELDDKPVFVIFFVWWPLVFYLGWIIAATVACIAAWLVSLKWSGAGIDPDTWAVFMLLIATFIYLYLLQKRNMREATSVGAWAFIAIAVKQWNQHFNIVATAIILTVVMFLLSAVHGRRNKYFAPHNKIKRGELWH